MNRDDGYRRLEVMLTAVAAAGQRCEAVVEPPIGITNRGRRILAAAARQRADLIVVGARGAAEPVNDSETVGSGI